jgi:hypothetical protein
MSTKSNTWHDHSISTHATSLPLIRLRPPLALLLPLPITPSLAFALTIPLAHHMK